jgi:hypothetical protein
MQAFEPLGDIERSSYHRLAVARSLKAGLAFNGARQGDGIQRVLRHQLA